MLTINQAVPEFDLEGYQNEQTRRFKLSDYRGKWLVVMFYPADFTFVCPTELKEAASYYKDFQAEGAEIVSVSTDTVFVHKAWHDESPAIKTVEFPMLADPAGRVTRLFGTHIEEEGLSLRATFIINPEGVLKWYEIHDNSIGRSFKEILRKLRAAKFVASHAGIVCPASWEPGEETLEPGLPMVGKI